MTSNGNYPTGANVPWAPWNEPEIKEKEIEVTVSITLSKTVQITVPDIKNISEYELKDAVKSQIYLPGEINTILSLPDVSIPNNVIKDLDNWVVDDFEVIQE